MDLAVPNLGGRDRCGGRRRLVLFLAVIHCSDPLFFSLIHYTSMPISGPQAHQQLIAAYDQTAAQLERLRGQLGQVEQHRDRLEDDRDQTLTKLAEYYLPDLTTDSIQKTWAGIRPSMHEILLRKEGRLRELKTQLEDENFFRTNLEANLKDTNDRLDAAAVAAPEVEGGTV